MGVISYTYTLTDGTTASAAQVQTSLDEAKTVVNGSLDATNLTAATAALLGLTRGTTVSRGKSIISTTESRTNAAYGTLTTPDTVTVTLPTDGLIYVAYQAIWRETVSGNARAAIFVGANQLKAAMDDVGNVGAQPQAAAMSNSAGIDRPLATGPVGLASLTHNTAGAVNVTTGQAVGIVAGAGDSLMEQGTTVRGAGPTFGGPVAIFAAAGTYAVSVQFKASSGCTVKDRRLWVRAEGF